MGKALIPVPGHVFGNYPENTSSPAVPGVAAALRARLEDSGAFTRWKLRGLRADARRILAHQATMPGFPGQELRNQLNVARAEMARDGLGSNAALRCMAGVLTCIRSVTGLQLRENQIMAALTVLRGQLAEVPTGEGKTLSTALAAATAALAGIPVHVVTANDYLAARDADQLRPIYRLLGMRVSALRQDLRRHERIEAYACDLCYCSAKELVFDYLRDRLASAPHVSAADGEPQRVLRGLCMAIIDEADSVLIDEALTPFILSESYTEPEQLVLCTLALHIARGLHAERDFVRRPGHFELTASGAAVVARFADTHGAALWSVPQYREELVVLALSAWHGFHRDEHYIVRDGKLHIVDPNTGRIAEGRAWSRGLHQMIEIKERLKPTPATRVLAQISFQRFFPRYFRVGGMSGTLAEARRELLETYGLSVLRIPPHKTSQLHIAPPFVYAHKERRWAKVLDDIARHHAARRPVLIGTDSVRDSEFLSQLLQRHGLPHRVLNARQDREEAELIARAGTPGAITVATNMAGRGTDIHIPPEVAQRGGLHVISCQHNSARRIDRQLYGRAGRQGQPGSAETMLSLEEGLLGRVVPDTVRRALGATLRSDGRLPIIVARALTRFAQNAEEARSQKARRRLRAQDLAMQQTMHFGHRAE